MTQADNAMVDDEVFAADTDIVEQIEDDDPDEHAGDEVAYDLDAASEGGA
jgi:hypothetical protein